MYIKGLLVIDVAADDGRRIDPDEIAEAVRDRLARDRIDAAVEVWLSPGAGA